MTAHYDTIGEGYAAARRPDQRIAARVAAALGDATSVVNVGAGAGAYEPAATVLAVEPSQRMIDQRQPGAAPAVRASAESLPLPNGCADASLALFTVHHWTDATAGLRELRRVARRRVVVLTWDRLGGAGFWLVRDYIAENYAWDSRRFRPIADIAAVLAAPSPAGPAWDVRIELLPILHDCADGFLGAYWRRPEAYLDPRVRASMSNFSMPGAPPVDEGLTRLAADLESGTWHDRYSDLLALDELDVGYRLVIAESGI